METTYTGFSEEIGEPQSYWDGSQSEERYYMSAQDDDDEKEEETEEWGAVDPEYDPNLPPGPMDPSGPGSAV